MYVALGDTVSTFGSETDLIYSTAVEAVNTEHAH